MTETNDMIDFRKENPVKPGYYVSYLEFLGPKPETLQKFDWVSPLTRANFTSWLVTSFALSRGQQRAHIPFFLWCDVNLGYNSEDTLYDFEASLGESDSQNRFNISSNEEIDFIRGAFTRQPEHQNRIKEHEDETQKEIETEHILSKIDEQLGYEDLEHYDDTHLPFNLRKKSLEGVIKEAFLQRLDVFIKQLKDEDTTLDEIVQRAIKR
jgi:hypothetical protein